jgi:hypothetical protein
MEHETALSGDLRKDLRDCAEAAHHLPQMVIDRYALELRNGIPGDHLHHLARRM